ncbi:hypothetical protein VPHK469_0093 [Vibrio phage K469]
MALRVRLETLAGGSFESGEALVEAFYDEEYGGLEVEWLGNGEYCTWQLDSKFENGRAEGCMASDMEITAWAFRKLIGVMLDAN